MFNYQQFILLKEYYELGFQINQHLWETYCIMLNMGHWDNKLGTDPNKGDFYMFIMDSYRKSGGSDLKQKKMIGRSWWKCHGYNSPTFLIIVDHIMENETIENSLNRDELYKLVVRFYTIQQDFRAIPLAGISFEAMKYYGSSSAGYDLDNIKITRKIARESLKWVLIETVRKTEGEYFVDINHKIIELRPQLWLDWFATVSLTYQWSYIYEYGEPLGMNMGRKWKTNWRILELTSLA